MKIYDMQQLTLLDFPGRVACTVFMSGCNLKCPYCHNHGVAASDVDEGRLFDRWILEHLSKEHVKRRLDGVAITGGEPLLNDGLGAFMKKLKDLGYLVKLDTNGTLPERLSSVIDGGLVDYVAMDIKASFGKYARVCGVKDLKLQDIRRSIEAIMEAGAKGSIEYEFRTTFVDELLDENDFDQIGKVIEGAQKYYIQAFVDSPGVPCRGFHAPDRVKLQRCLEAVRRRVPAAELRGWME